VEIKIKWWQLFFYEMAVISLGIILGVLWSDFFENFIYPLFFLFAFCGGYTVYFLTKQVVK